MIHKTLTSLFVTLAIVASSSASAQEQASPNASTTKDIKSYCIDFNWGIGRKAGFAKPGNWATADPKEHVAWYKSMAANVIQTFAVSCNGYAWYKSDLIPEQPGLKHDFLTEVVKLGHVEGMKVMGYFCIAANRRWGEANPELSYGTPDTYHIPYTDEYLAYLSSAITDAIKTTGIDGFMIDWVWMPRRTSTNKKWIQAEKDLYQQLMGEPFPGEEKLTKIQDTAYSRKAIDRCWKTIHKAAKEADPDCIIWLTTNNTHHPHVVGSDMYREVDWLMGETGKLDKILELKALVGEQTQLITCMSDFGGSDATKQVPEAIEAGVGLYGYAKPSNNGGTIDLNGIFPKQLSQLYGNSLRIAVLARAYRGLSIDSVWENGIFIEPDPLPAFRIKLRGRRGFNDLAKTDFDDDQTTITIHNPYRSGRAQLTRLGGKWPAKILIKLDRHPGRDGPSCFQVANGEIGVGIDQENGIQVIAGKMEGGLDLKKAWHREGFLNGGNPESPIPMGDVEASMSDQFTEFVIPGIITKNNPEAIAFEWLTTDRVR